MHAILKKKYGQNFLIDKNILVKISNLIPENFLNIIEIGPGDGRLSSYIINFKPNLLKIIEVDSDLIPILNSKFKKENNIKIVNEDILKYKLNEKIDLIISNLPYNISSQILVKICLMNNLPNNLILMFQKEFAQRLIDKKLNSLNSLVKCFYDINLKFNVSRNCFKPSPKIDSSVLFFSLKEKILLSKNEINKFIEFKRGLFSYKRKSLKNLLRGINISNNEFDLSKRVEQISLEELIKIFRNIN